MTALFKTMLLIIITISFIWTFASKDKKKAENMVFICAIAIAVFFASAMWL